MDDVQPSEPQDDVVVDSASAPEDQGLEAEATENRESGEAQPEEKVTFDERQQAKVDELIGQKVAKLRDIERERDDARQQLADAQASIPQPKEPKIPELPDPMDVSPEEFQRAQEAREKAIVERAEFQAAVKARESLEQQEAQKRQLAEQQAVVKRVNGYFENATSFGMKQEDVAKEGAQVGDFLGQGHIDLQNHIADDPHGPLITNFLSKNLGELELIRSMTPIDAAVYIATEVKPKVSGTRKTTNAPNPANIVDGAGAPEKQHPALEGAIIE